MRKRDGNPRVHRQAHAGVILAFFGVIIAVNLTMAYFANSTWSGLVVANGYVASQSFDEDLAKARAQDALGWNVEASAIETNRVRVTFADRSKAAARPASTSPACCAAPSPTRQDQALTFASEGAGVYIGSRPHWPPASGRSRSPPRAPAARPITRSFASS